MVNQANSISGENLKLRAPHETTKVLQPSNGNRTFHQDLCYNGKRLVLRTASIPSSNIKFSENHSGKRILIPVSMWLRKQFNVIEEYAILNMTFPSDIGVAWQARDDNDTAYKKIWGGDTICLYISNWCKFYRQDSNSMTEIQPHELGNGNYVLDISIPGVYFGHHRDNKLASLTMRVQQIAYIPESDVDKKIEYIHSQEEVEVKHDKCKRKRRMEVSKQS